MSHFFRLFYLLRVTGRYRLDEFLKRQKGTLLLRTVLAPFFIGRNLHLAKPIGVRLRKSMEELGPVYVKFGQLLSTRRDFLPDDLADELRSLQDNVPPFEFPPIETIVKDGLGIEIFDVFENFEQEPFASASVAQVHNATLKNGDQVVVKVLRPGIEKTIRQDLKLLKSVARLIHKTSAVGRRLRLIDVVNDYEKIIFNELDLRSEAANTTQLARNFNSSPELYIPKIYWDFTSHNIMVMEKIHGVPVSDIEKLKESGVDLKRLAETGVNIFFTQVFEHNFFHADMHPGNIFVSTSSPQQPQYIAIDCAIIGSLSSSDQEYLARNLLAIFKRDYKKVAELHIECGWVSKETKVYEFESSIRTVCEPIFEKPLKEISFGKLLVQLFQTASRFDMEVQPSLVLLQKTLLNVEGLGRQLYPDLDLWQTALPYLEKWNYKRLSPLTLIDKIKENIPRWVDQLPNLPQLVVENLILNTKLQTNQATILAEQVKREAEIKTKRRLKTCVGIALILLAGVSMAPTVLSFLNNTQIVTLILAGFGIYFLYFDR